MAYMFVLRNKYLLGGLFFFVFNLPKTLIIVFSNIYGTTSLVLTLIRDKNFFGYLFILIFNGRQHAVNKS